LLVGFGRPTPRPKTPLILPILQLLPSKVECAHPIVFDSL
jgi:hypothetical protein